MKTVVITGANRGLGLELVKKFSAEGWQVIAACRQPKDFPSDQITKSVTVAGLDISDQQSCPQPRHG